MDSGTYADDIPGAFDLTGFFKFTERLRYYCCIENDGVKLFVRH